MNEKDFLISVIKETNLLQYLTIDELKEIHRIAFKNGWIK